MVKAAGPLLFVLLLCFAGVSVETLTHGLVRVLMCPDVLLSAADVNVK